MFDRPPVNLHCAAQVHPAAEFDAVICRVGRVSQHRQISTGAWFIGQDDKTAVLIFGNSDGASMNSKSGNQQNNTN